jgi:hypothetical protein
MRSSAAELQTVSEESGQAGTRVRVFWLRDPAKGFIRKIFLTKSRLGSTIASPLTLTLSPLGGEGIKERQV